MSRAVLVDVACFRDGARFDRLLRPLAREFLAIPVSPRAVSWDRLDPALAIELPASWLVVAPGSLAGLDPSLPARLRGCVVAGSPPRGRARPGWTPAADLLAALALVRRRTLAARVLCDYGEIDRISRALRRRGRRIVFTNGVFDLFHLGHLRALEEARGLGDTLVVGVNSDESAARLKGRARPLLRAFARAAVVAGCRAVDWVVVFGEDTPLELLRAVRPHVLAKGGDYRPAGVVGGRLVRGWGGRVAIVPLVEGASTTALLRRIRRGH